MTKKTVYGSIIVAGILMIFGISSCNRLNLVQQPTTQKVAVVNSELDREIRRVMEKGSSLEDRQAQVPAIEAVFARRTDPERARWLAALCYLKTLGTSFSPIDIAEIALVETGGHGLSGRAVSNKGALGVWQLMPNRAASHGYSPEEMQNDEKCAEAAVRELASKLEMANGKLVRAKKLYCGVGPQADAYEVKRRQIRKEILAEITTAAPQRAELRYRIERPS
jgi:hypothetical protein